MSEAINQVIPSVAEISDPIVRAHYAQKLTRLAKVEESYISQQIANIVELSGYMIYAINISLRKYISENTFPEER